MPRMYIAYEVEEPGLPVAAGESMPIMARQLGITQVALWRLMRGDTEISKKNKFGIPLKIVVVEFDEDEEGGD